MKRIALLTPRLSRYDAVSNDVLKEYEILEQNGFDVRIFTESTDPFFVSAPFVKNIKDAESFEKGASESLVICHYSSLWRAGLSFLEAFRASSEGRIMLRYHNITPARFFEPYHAGYAQSCRDGRAFLQKMIKDNLFDSFLATSEFSKQELLDLGAKNVEVLAPFHQAEALLRTKADLDFLKNLRALGGPRFLTVGRVAPNKGLVFLLRFFALYLRHSARPARLLIAGSMDENLKKYNDELEQVLREEEIGASVQFTGPLSESELKAAFLGSDVLIHASEHEGFCVPLLEAQALGLPVLALRRAAVPETLGEGGLLWEESEPELFAASLEALTTRPELREDLILKGRTNYETRFSERALTRGFLSFLEEKGENIDIETQN